MKKSDLQEAERIAAELGSKVAQVRRNERLLKWVEKNQEFGCVHCKWPNEHNKVGFATAELCDFVESQGVPGAVSIAWLFDSLIETLSVMHGPEVASWLLGSTIGNAVRIDRIQMQVLMECVVEHNPNINLVAMPIEPEEESDERSSDDEVLH